VTAYIAPDDQQLVINADPVVIDGTRHPYLTRLHLSDVIANAISPNQYQWRGVWQGEGYDRIIDPTGNLATKREKGADIDLTVTYRVGANSSSPASLIVQLKSHQNLTAQLTNLSAFLMDAQTGEVRDRKDFPQLPPIYDVTLTPAYGKPVTKRLERLGAIVFEYHLPSEEVRQLFPLQIEAENRFWGDRLQEIAELEAKGWVIREVPEAT
jgi:hypothetical protein